jgi:hypothetical protein
MFFLFALFWRNRNMKPRATRASTHDIARGARSDSRRVIERGMSFRKTFDREESRRKIAA